jgi:hypothetical protein
MTMESFMMKRAFCARCNADMGMMIQDDAPHPTCFACLDRALGTEMISDSMIKYFGFLFLITSGIILLLLL